MKGVKMVCLILLALESFFLRALEISFAQEHKKFPVVVVDDEGRKVRIEREPRHIISLAPSNTEILFALGLKDRLIGVTDLCNYPLEARRIERVGDFDRPNLEKIVQLEPGLIIASGGGIHRPLMEKLENLGYSCLVLYPRSLEEVLNSISLVGIATGKDREAGEYIKELKKRIEKVTAKVKTIPKGKRPKVFLELWSNPLMTAGQDSFVHELIELAGGINIAGDAKASFPHFSFESVIERDPDVIILGYMGGEEVHLINRPGWSSIKAIKMGRVYKDINPDLILRPSPRLVEGLEEIAKRLYPQLF